MCAMLCLVRLVLVLGLSGQDDGMHLMVGSLSEGGRNALCCVFPEYLSVLALHVLGMCFE